MLISKFYLCPQLIHKSLIFLLNLYDRTPCEEHNEKHPKVYIVEIKGDLKYSLLLNSRR